MWYWKGECPKEDEVLGEDAFGRIEAHRVYFNKAEDPDGVMTPKDRIAILAVKDHAIKHHYGEILTKSGRFIPLDERSEETISFTKAHCEYSKRPMKRHITNREWLENLSDGELAYWLSGVRVGDPEIFSSRYTDEWLKWLKEKHKEDKQ